MVSARGENRQVNCSLGLLFLVSRSDAECSSLNAFPPCPEDNSPMNMLGTRWPKAIPSPRQEAICYATDDYSFLPAHTLLG